MPEPRKAAEGGGVAGLGVMFAYGGRRCCGAASPSKLQAQQERRSIRKPRHPCILGIMLDFPQKFMCV